MIDQIAEAFRDAGCEIYLVGGYVRDHLLGVENKDLDYCTNALPEKTVEILSRFGKPHRVGERFGTIGLGDAEVTTYRTEQYKDNSRKPEVEFGTSLVDDLSRRDFTINAIALEPNCYSDMSIVPNGAYIDPFGGINDISNRIIRCVGSAGDRFSEDPLRMLRAIRFACRFGFTIEPNTHNAIRAKHRSILNISQERIQEELGKIITSDVRKGMTLLRETGLLHYIAPELVMLNDPRSQGFYHNQNIWGHTLSVAERTENNLVLRWAAILHDLGKMATRTDTNGEIHYYGHEDVSAILAESMLRRLRYSNDIIDRVCRLVRLHMQINHYGENWTDGTVRKLMDRLGDDIMLGINLAKCDQEAHKQGHHDPVNDLERRVIELKDKIENYLRIPINGNDLMVRYNRPPGPWIKEVKARLEELVIDGTLSPDDKDAAYEVADGLLGVR